MSVAVAVPMETACPEGPEHSTVTAAGTVRAGAVVSTTSNSTSAASESWVPSFTTSATVWVPSA